MYPEEMQDAQELNRYNNALNAATPELPNMDTRNLPDWYLDFEKDLEQMKHNLRNEFFDPTDKKNPWKKAGEPLLNASGINLFIGFLRATALSKNLIMSNLPTYNSAMEMSLDICLSTNVWLHKHYALGDIGLDQNDISYINDMVRPLSKASCLRAFQHAESRRVSATTRTNIGYDIQPGQPQQQGGWNGLWDRFRPEEQR